MKLYNHQFPNRRALNRIFCKQNILSLECALVVLILLWSFFRLYRLGQIPLSTYWDETAMMVDLKAVLATGRDMHGMPWYQAIYPSYGDYKLPLYLWLSLLPTKLFGVTALSLRMVSAATGLLTMVVAGLLAKTLTQSLSLSARMRRLIVLSTMLVIAASPWSFLFSRTAFEGHVSQLCVAFSVYLILSVSKNLWRGVLAGLVGALAIYGYYASRYVWFPLWLLSTLLLLSQTSRKLWRRYVLAAVIGLGVCVLLLAPLRQSPWYQPMQQFRLSASSILNPPPDAVMINQWREWSGNTLLSRVLFHQNWFLLKALASHYAQHVSLQTLFLQGDSNLRHSTTQHGLFLWPFFISFLAGGVFLLKRVRVLFFLLAWWLLALLPASVPSVVPHALRSLNGLVPLGILMGIGTAVILHYMYSQVLIHRVLSVMFLLTIVAASFSFLQYYFHIYPVDSADAWQDGYQDRVATLIDNRHGNEPVWCLVPDPRFYLYLMAYGPYSGQEFASWPEANFEKMSGDNLFFHSDRQNEFAQAVREKGEGLLLTDTNLDIESTRLELRFKNITCQSYTSERLNDTYRLCRVYPN